MSQSGLEKAGCVLEDSGSKNLYQLLDCTSCLEIESDLKVLSLSAKEKRWKVLVDVAHGSFFVFW